MTYAKSRNRNQVQSQNTNKNYTKTEHQQWITRTGMILKKWKFPLTWPTNIHPNPPSQSARARNANKKEEKKNQEA